MVKNIVVCCDGTWNDPKSKTNIFDLFEELIDQEYEQRIKYVEGVGAGSGIKLVIDGAIALSLDNRVKEAYKFIVTNYQPGDNIWLFGFSRGAYTARSVAGLIRNCGILKIQDERTIDRAYEIYRDINNTFSPDGLGTKEFKKEHSYPDSAENPPIKFLGLFDTVGARGLPACSLDNGFEYLELFDQVVPNVVKYARQALSVHERRSFFEPCRILQNNSSSVDIKETWFPGTHNDIGGGTSLTYEGNERISRATMLWMLENIAEVGGLLMKDTIENYRTRFDPSSGAKWNLRSLIFDRNYSHLPALFLRDRVINIEVDAKNQKMLKHGLLYKDGEWSVLGDRNSLRVQFVSNTYENLRKDMEVRGIRLYNGVKYDFLPESARSVVYKYTYSFITHLSTLLSFFIFLLSSIFNIKKFL